MKIYDSAGYDGSGTRELSNVLTDVAESTKTLELKARDLKIMTLTNYSRPMKTYVFQCFFIHWDKKRERFAPTFMNEAVTVDELKAIGADDTILEELRRDSLTMIDVAGVRFFMNLNFLKTYMQRGGSNSGDYANSADVYCRITRDYGVMAFLAVTPDLKMTLLYREDASSHAKKAFALFSETGTYVPQVNFWNSIAREFQKNFGKMRVANYRVTQEKTFVHAEFPEEGKACRPSFPEIPDACEPGIAFRTSDIGVSSLTVNGVMRIGNGAFFVIPKAEVTRSHKGYVEIKSVVDDCRKQILHTDDPGKNPYTAMMGRIAQLTGMHIPSGKVQDILKKVLKSSGLLKTLGSKRSARMVTEILSVFGDSFPEGGITAYSVAKAFLDLSGKYQGEFRDADTVERLRREFAGVITFSYEKELK